MINKTKKYPGVSVDSKGKIYFQTEFKASATGKRQRKKGYKDQFGKPFDTQKEAYEELCRVRADFASRFDYSDYNITFSQFMEDVYLPYYKQTVQDVTYRTAMTQHNAFIERFGKKELRSISKRDCESYRLYLMANYSANYAKGVWVRFKKCLGYAERLDYIKDFPCKALDTPRGSHPETKFWTYEEFQKVLKTFDLTDYEDRLRYSAIWLYFMTGVRVSEGFALIWSNFSESKKMLRVEATLERDKNGKFYRKIDSKKNQTTKSHYREIELDDETVRILKEWRSVQVQNSRQDYIISFFGNPMDKSTLSRTLKRHALKAGVPVITGKGLRHSHDSFMINVLKMDVVEISNRSGRRDKATTLNTYSHYYQTGTDFNSKLTKAIGKVAPHQ